MKICMLTSCEFPPKEGIGTHIYFISQELIRRGHEITLVTRGNVRRLVVQEYEGIKLIKPVFVPLKPFHIHIQKQIISRLFRRMASQYDILHLHMPLVPLVKTTLPLVTTFHTLMLTDTRAVENISLKTWAIKLKGKYMSYPLEKHIICRSSALIVVSETVKRELQEYYPVEGREIYIVRNAAQSTLFKPGRWTEGRENFVLYVGRLGYRKGLLDLVKAAKFVLRTYEDLRFKLAGSGELEGLLKKTARKFRIEANFDFLGHLDRKKIIWLYQNAAMCVIPSHYEGLPNTLLEAMSCGLPVVATDIGSISEIIENGENGLLIPPKSPEKLTEAIITLLENETLRCKLAKNARKTAEQMTWEKSVDKLERVYEAVR